GGLVRLGPVAGALDRAGGHLRPAAGGAGRRAVFLCHALGRAQTQRVRPAFRKARRPAARCPRPVPRVGLGQPRVLRREHRRAHHHRGPERLRQQRRERRDHHRGRQGRRDR
nr:hypothetical protein [Tanacetum cinerariifolium]